MRKVLAGLAVAVGAGCAAIAGIPERSGTLCAREDHDFCEDFDNPTAAQSFDTQDDPAAEAGLTADASSPPSALAIRLPAVASDGRSQVIRLRRFERSPHGMRLTFALRIANVETLKEGLPIGDGGPPDGALFLLSIGWDRGTAALVAARSGLYAFWDTNNPGPAEPPRISDEPIAEPFEFVGRFVTVDVEINLEASPPRFTMSAGSRPRTFDLQPVSGGPKTSTTLLIGARSQGPTGPLDVSIDDIRVDFP